jgi:hypothetical protein
MVKNLCKWKKKDIKKDFKKLSRAVSGARYICCRCGRAASSKKYLCKPTEMET